MFCIVSQHPACFLLLALHSEELDEQTNLKPTRPWVRVHGNRMYCQFPPHPAVEFGRWISYEREA
jgi:hypothetical protein